MATKEEPVPVAAPVAAPKEDNGNSEAKPAEKLADAPAKSGYNTTEHLMSVAECADKYATHVVPESPAKSAGLTAAEVRPS